MVFALYEAVQLISLTASFIDDSVLKLIRMVSLHLLEFLDVYDYTDKTIEATYTYIAGLFGTFALSVCVRKTSTGYLNTLVILGNLAFAHVLYVPFLQILLDYYV